MRRFFDLHVIPTLQDEAQTERIVKRTSELGYGGVGLVLPSNIPPQKISKLRRLCNDQGLDFVMRVNLKPSNVKELLSTLKRVRRRFEVVSILCASKSLARQAAKDKRVDLLNFPINSRCHLDKQEAELASKSNVAFEVNMTSLITSWGYHLTRLLYKLRMEVSLAERFGIPIILSSGTSNVWMMRCPKDWVAIASLFDMSEEEASEALSDTPSEMVIRNRDKLNSKFLHPGVRVVVKG